MSISTQSQVTFRMAAAQMRYRMTPEQSDGQMAIVEALVDPQAIFAIPHVHHREDEAIHVIEGSCRVIIGHDIHDLQAGESIFMPRGIPHAVVNMNEAHSRILLVLTPGHLAPFFKELSDAEPELPTLPAAAMENISEAMAQMPQQTMMTLGRLFEKYGMTPPQA